VPRDGEKISLGETHVPQFCGTKHWTDADTRRSNIFFSTSIGGGRRFRLCASTGAHNIKVSDGQLIILNVQGFGVIYHYPNRLRQVTQVNLAQVLL
jgi:hypothetical protein